MILPLIALLLAAAPTVARVNGEAITSDDLRRREAVARQQGLKADKKTLLDHLISEALLAQEARRLGLDRSPELRAVVDTERRRLAAEHLMESEILSAAKVDEETLRRMFHANADSVDLDAVILGSEADARQCLDRLRAGGDLAAEAKSSYDPRGAAQKGRLGTMRRSQLATDLEEVAFSVPIGQFQGPVKLELGWGVVRVRSRQIGNDADFAKKKKLFRRFAEQQAKVQVKQHYVAQLRKQLNVVLDDAFLKQTATRVDATPAEANRTIATVRGRPLRYGEVIAALRRFAGGKVGGHMSGAIVKTELAWELLDRMALEEAAIERGHGDAAPVRAALAGIERELAFRALATRLEGPSRARDAVLRRGTELRDKARIEIDPRAIETRN